MQMVTGRVSLWWIVVAVLAVLGQNGQARAQAGDAFAAECAQVIAFVATDFQNMGDAIVADTIAKINAMRASGAPESKVQSAAAKGQAKVSKTAERCRKVASKLAQQCFTRLIRFDEPSLIAQITQVHTARNTALMQINNGETSLLSQISAAL